MKADSWRQVDEILEPALRLPPGKRVGFIADACEGDADLRREVESLLTHLEDAASFLETPPAEIAADLLVSTSARLEAGQCIDDYEILSRLGGGGMGDVYLATDTRLHRTVALKILSAQLAIERGYRRRFQEEARLASNLNHPNIVTIYGVGDVNDIAYIAMEFVRGETLGQVLAQGRMPMRRAFDIALQVAEALTAAHTSGVVHRDLKPENVMVTPGGLVKVLDFGLARRETSGTTATLASMTRAGMILGTVGYMSPEQASGKVAGHAADQFGLGAMFYEMLTGRRAFERETAVETLSAIIREHPPAIYLPQSAASPLVNSVLARCLMKDPADRFGTTKELVDQLRQIQDMWPEDDQTLLASVSESSAIASDLPSTTSLQLTRRHLLWVGAAGLLSVASGLTAWSRFWDPGIRSLAILPFANVDNLDSASYLSETLRDGLFRRLQTLSTVAVTRGSGSSSLQGITDLPAMGRRLDVDGVLTGSFYERSGTIYVEAALIDVERAKALWRHTYSQRKLDLIALQDDIGRDVVEQGLGLPLNDDDRRRLMGHLSPDPEANVLYERAMSHLHREDEEGYLTARRLFMEAVNKDADFALAYVGLASSYQVMAIDGYESPLDNAVEVRRNIQKALDLAPNLIEAHYALAAEELTFNWNWPAAEREFRIAGSSPGAWDADAAVLAYWAMGDPEQALVLIRRTLYTDKLNLAWRLKEADIVAYLARYDQAGKLYEGIIADEVNDPRAYFGLAEVRRKQEQFDAAIKVLREGWEKHQPEEPIDEPLRLLFDTARGASGYRELEKKLMQLEIDRLEARFAAGAYTSPLDIARAYAVLGDRQNALKYLDAAFRERAPGLVFLKVDPAWNEFRVDPSFLDVMRKVGLPWR
jgi:serine/threonine-protein kinase